MHTGVPSETRPGESRVAVTPETTRKLVVQGHRVMIQSGAGAGANFPDEAFSAVGVQIVDAATASGADLVLKVQSLTEAEMPLLKRGAVLVGMLDPFNHRALEATLLASEGRTAAAEAVGRSFAVVANEVRALAQRTSSSAKEIHELISVALSQIEIGARHAFTMVYVSVCDKRTVAIANSSSRFHQCLRRRCRLLCHGCDMLGHLMGLLALRLR